MLRWLQSLRNNVDYPIRQFIRWRRGARSAMPESKAEAFQRFDDGVRTQTTIEAQKIIERFKLNSLLESCSLRDYTTNLYYLAMMEEAFQLEEAELPNRLLVADVGTGSWNYAPALHNFLMCWGSPEPRNLEIHGFEIDAYRVFNDLRSRFDHAEGYLSSLSGLQFRPTPFRTAPDQYDLITMFFPFVFPGDHLSWGLPKKLFRPEILLRAVWESLKGDGILFIANQGAEEFEEQKRLASMVGIKGMRSIPFASRFHDYEIPRFVHIVQKK